MFNISTHNGRITTHNPATGQHRTFRIRTQPADSKFAPGKRVVALLTGPDNENDYQPFGFVFDGGRIVLWKKHRDSQVFRAYASMLTHPDHYATEKRIEYAFEGRCRVCNRALTTPESVASGIGPVCAGR